MNMNKASILLLTCFTLSSSLVLGETLSTDIKTNSPKESKKSSFFGELTLQSNQIVDDVGEVEGNSYFGDANLSYEYRSGAFASDIDLRARVNDAGGKSYSVPEFKISYETNTSKVTAGRSILAWSEADKVWGLGKVNNRVNFDFFEPEQEGLFGIMYDKKFNSGVTLGVFGSMVYIPELNPGLNVDKSKGTVTCDTPWCKAPSPSAEITEGTQTPIYYDVQEPEITDVILRYSAGLKLGFETEKFSVDTFYMSKPENGISVSAEIKYETGIDRIYVDVTPQFYYHDVVGGNMKYNFSANEDTEFSVYASALSVTPNKFPDGNQEYIEYTGIKPRKLKEEYGSTGLLFSDERYSFHVGYIARLSGFDKKDDILVEYPRWNQAGLFAASAKITQKLSTSVDAKFDMITEDRLLMLKMSYLYANAIELGVGIQMIGTNGSGETYWSEYENNDSAYGSLKYVF